MPLIRECIVATVSPNGRPHLAPLGLISKGEEWIISPFRPSTTLENLAQRGCAVASLTDDARAFAGLLTGRRDWPLVSAGAGWRLANALAHWELEVIETHAHPQRPRFVCRVAARATHAPFEGFNRAVAAVVEAAVLVSRLDILPRSDIEVEFARLAIIVDKTAGEAEREAFGWLKEKVAAHGT